MGEGTATIQAETQRTRLLLPIILIVSLFFLWGVANNLNDVLIKHFKKAFTLSDFQSGLVQSAFYFGYFCFAIPAALFMKRFGYKAAVVLGLVLFGVGALLFVPAAHAHSYAFFLLALYVIASGLAFLETSANPLVTALGDPKGAARRLNLAQAFNPLGAISGVLIGSSFILSGIDLTPEQLAALPPDRLDSYLRFEALAVVGPYTAIGVFVLGWALLVGLTRFPAAASRPEPTERVGSVAEFRSLLSRPRYLFGVTAQFFYVGAQVGVWSFLIRYAQVERPGTDERTAATMLTVSLVLFLIGRFAGAALMGRVPPARLLAWFGAANIALCLVAAFVGGSAGLVALIGTSLFMSIMFPTIFALSLEDLGPLTKPGASLLVMAIIGGAVITALMGLVSDHASIALAMLLPAVSFACVALFGASAPRR
ncbi:L-fucose:H+ symporter permease [Sphingomonas gilva]|uniref:L-fucose:H+ symporter permease n=1 Tax=Sphingomonas gilva TaxID=2305907 RepID=A0A396RRC7_9SPHN|nr:L-fucose:H+ symporter permease [Sphingomonas gilva]RHW18939.1 L-fucose:H+ symporter permease [Sphingomonas gilva]